VPSTAAGKASDGSRKDKFERTAALSRRYPYRRSRAANVLLLLCVLFFSACAEIGSENAAVPEGEKTASDAEITRAAQGEGESGPEVTSEFEALEKTEVIEAENAAVTVAEQAEETAFDHRAAEDNSRGDYTYLDDPSINGEPNAAVSATAFAGGEASEDGEYHHNIGIWYEPEEQKWAIFNQDLAAVSAGAGFRVVVPRRDEAFIHRATRENTSGSSTYIDDPLANGRPDAGLSITQNWNPGGGQGVYNDHPVGISYDAEREKWKIYNQDGSAMPEGAAFNVTVSEAARAASTDSVVPDAEGGFPEYRDFYSEGNPETPTDLISANPTVGAIPPVKPFNFGRDPGGPEDKTLYLTIPKLELKRIPVFDSLSEDKLHDGTVHIPATGYPWQKGANVFIAGHRIGFPNTDSYYVFFHLDWLEKGDEILLHDSSGRKFTYRVTDQKIVGPENVDVMNAVEGKSMISLQTCTLPDYKDRLIIQGELVESDA